MKKKLFLMKMLAMALVVGMAVVGCGDGSSNNNDDNTVYVPPAEKPALTGIVTVSSNITTYLATETMTLTAGTSELGGSGTISYKWLRNDTEIGGETSSTHTVKELDYGKTLKVKVSRSGYSGEITDEFQVKSPTVCTLTLKWDANAGKKDTGIIIEREDGTSWLSTSGNLTIDGKTVTLSSWQETKFKMRTEYTTISSKHYFKKDNASGSELFDLTNGAVAYTLTNMFQTSVLYNLFATEE
jgi:hypothetical protein